MALPFQYRKGPPRRTRVDPDYSGSPVPILPYDDSKPSKAVVPPAEIPMEPVVDPSLLSVTPKPTQPVEPLPVRPRVVTPEVAVRPRRADVQESPWSIEYSKGRPVGVTTTGTDAESELQAQQALKKSTDEYIPQKPSGWRRYLLPALRYAAAVGAGRGGAHPAAMGGAAIVGALEGVFNPRAGEEAWKTQRQAQIGAGIDQTLKRRREEATIENLELQPALKQQASEQRQQGLDIRGQRVSDLRMQNALKDYNGRNYTPGENPALDQYYADSGLHELPPHQKDETYQLVWSGGQLLRVPKGKGEAENVTNDGAPVVDDGKLPNKSVTIDGVTYDYLTSKEAALLTGRVSEGSKNRSSRERVAAQSQAGQDRRSAAGIAARTDSSRVLNPALRSAIAAISKFRSLTTQIERARSYGDNQTAEALQTERDGHEKMMRQVYGPMLQNDDKGKPTVLSEEFANPPNTNDGPDSSAVPDLTGQSRSLSEWRKKYPQASADQERRWKTNIERAGGKVIK